MGEDQGSANANACTDTEATSPDDTRAAHYDQWEWYEYTTKRTGETLDSIAKELGHDRDLIISMNSRFPYDPDAKLQKNTNGIYLPRCVDNTAEHVANGTTYTLGAHADIGKVCEIIDEGTICPGLIIGYSESSDLPYVIQLVSGREAVGGKGRRLGLRLESGFTRLPRVEAAVAFRRLPVLTPPKLASTTRAHASASTPALTSSGFWAVLSR